MNFLTKEHLHEWWHWSLMPWTIDSAVDICSVWALHRFQNVSSGHWVTIVKHEYPLVTKNCFGTYFLITNLCCMDEKEIIFHYPLPLVTQESNAKEVYLQYTIQSELYHSLPKQMAHDWLLIFKVQSTVTVIPRQTQCLTSQTRSDSSFMLYVALIGRGLGKTKWNGPGKLKLEGQKKMKNARRRYKTQIRVQCYTSLIKHPQIQINDWNKIIKTT